MTMIHVTDDQFETLVSQAVQAIPSRFADHLENVAFLVAEEPTSDQHHSSETWHSEQELLLGLYEGIPLPARDAGYTMVLPDVITIFKHPHELIVNDFEAMRAAVHQTVWHEVAHYFGLDHGQIEALER